MQENISLAIERLSVEQERKFRIASVLQIQSLLRGLSEKGSLAALYFDGTKDFIMTSVLGVGDKGLWVEQDVDMRKNRRVGESQRITLVSSLDQVKIQFLVDRIKATTHQGYPAFYLPLPDSLYRLQHREYYRLALPLSGQLRCIIPTGEPSAASHCEAPVMDISIGGIRLFYADNDIEFAPGQIYAGCRINLPEVGVISATLVVKNLTSVSPKAGQVVKRVGCEFKDLDAASGILLQRYITKVQRSRAAM